MAALKRWLMRGWFKAPQPVTAFEAFCWWYDFQPRCAAEAALREHQIEMLWPAVGMADIQRMGEQ